MAPTTKWLFFEKNKMGVKKYAIVVSMGLFDPGSCVRCMTQQSCKKKTPINNVPLKDALGRIHEPRIFLFHEAVVKY